MLTPATHDPCQVPRGDLDHCFEGLFHRGEVEVESVGVQEMKSGQHGDSFVTVDERMVTSISSNGHAALHR